MTAWHRAPANTCLPAWPRGHAWLQVRTLFAVAGWVAPSVIFIDEIDSLLSARKSEGARGLLGPCKLWGLWGLFSGQRCGLARKQLGRLARNPEGAQGLLGLCRNHPVGMELGLWVQSWWATCLIAPLCRGAGSRLAPCWNSAGMTLVQCNESVATIAGAPAGEHEGSRRLKRPRC
jgi:SpoVK/Ycf46/Vps4 family AAA+-type ATPase